MPGVARESGLVVFVAGRPTPQGSKKHIGRGRMVEVSKHLPPWRQAIVSELTKAVGRTAITWDGEPLCKRPTFIGAIALDLEFVMSRPQAMSANKPTPLATKRPDLDKLSRAVFDGAQMAGMFADDSNVVELVARKRIAQPGESSGCWIRIREIGEP